MWNDNEFLWKELESVEGTIKKSLRTRNKIVEEALVGLAESGGKRLRLAALSWLSRLKVIHGRLAAQHTHVVF